MKKIIFLLLCVILVFAMPVVAFAEETEVDTEAAPEEETVTETIVGYVQEHFEEISVIGTLALTIFYEINKHRKLNGSIGTLNNNAIAVAQNSSMAIDSALTKVMAIAETVQGYKDEFNALLTEIRTSVDEKRSLEETLGELEKHLKASKLANMEFANELAELLCLANIPNAKKEELYSRHRAALASIEVEEVNADDGAEA